MVTKSGRHGVGEFEGSRGSLIADAGGLREYRIRLRKAQSMELADLLAQATSLGGFILTVTREKLDRMRVLFDPAPKYERRAATHYLRSDVMRVTGSEKSCNIYISSQGVTSVQSLLRAAANEADEWIELRARIVHRRGGSRGLLELVPDCEMAAEAEQQRLGEAGTALAGEVWPADDFSDWEQSDA